MFTPNPWWWIDDIVWFPFSGLQNVLQYEGWWICQWTPGVPETPTFVAYYVEDEPWKCNLLRMISEGFSKLWASGQCGFVWKLGTPKSHGSWSFIIFIIFPLKLPSIGTYPPFLSTLEWSLKVINGLMIPVVNIPSPNSSNQPGTLHEGIFPTHAEISARMRLQIDVYVYGVTSKKSLQFTCLNVSNRIGERPDNWQGHTISLFIYIILYTSI